MIHNQFRDQPFNFLCRVERCIRPGISLPRREPIFLFEILQSEKSIYPGPDYFIFRYNWVLDFKQIFPTDSHKIKLVFI